MSTTSDVDNGPSGDVVSHNNGNNSVINGTVSLTETAVGLVDKAEWLQKQIDIHNIEILADRNEENENLNRNVIDEIPKPSLQEELFSQYAEKDKREIMIKRMQLGRTLTDELFKQDEDTDDAGKTRTDTAYLEDLLERQCSVVTEIMKNIQAVELDREKLKGLKKANADLMNENRKKMHVINEKNKAKKRPAIDEETKEMTENLDRTVQQIAIIRHTLQGLVIGSGVNWAQDPEIEEMVLQLGEKLDFI